MTHTILLVNRFKLNGRREEHTRMSSGHVLAARLVHQAQRKAIQNYKKTRRQRQQKKKRQPTTPRRSLLLKVLLFPFTAWMISIGVLIAILCMIGQFCFTTSLRVGCDIIAWWHFRHAPKTKLSRCLYLVEELNQEVDFQFVLDGRTYILKAAAVERLYDAAFSIICLVDMYLYGQWVETTLYIGDTTALELINTYQPRS